MSLKDKLEQLTQEVSKSPDVTVQVEDKGINIEPVSSRTQEEDQLVEGKTHSHVTIQRMKIPNKNYVSNSKTIVPEKNQKISTPLIRESQTKKVPYQHPNHESRQLNQATCQDHSKHKQQTDVPDNSDITSIQSYDDKPLQNSNDQNIPQKINLGWSYPLSVRQFCLSLRRSYQFVLTKMIVPR